MAQLRKFQFLRNTAIAEPFASYADARTAAATAFSGITLLEGEIALYSYKLTTTGDTVHTLLGIKRNGGIEILGNYDELTAEYQSYVTNAINALDTPEGGVTGSNNGVSVTVKQVNGKITEVSVDATNLNSAITTAINALDATVRGTSDGVVAADSFTVTGATGAYVAVEVVEQDGKLTGVNVKENIDETITANINTLNANKTSDNGTNVQVQVVEEAGVITGVNITTDNTVNADDVDDAIEEVIAGLESSAENATGNIKVKVSQANGKLTSVEVTDTLAKVAHTGKSIDVTIDDTANNFEANNVEDALAELASDIATLAGNQLGAGKGIIIDNNKKINADLALEYNDNYTITLTDSQGNSFGTINAKAFIKDGMVNSASLVTNPEGQEEGTYIALVFNTDVDGQSNHDTIYIPVNDLIDTYTAGNDGIVVDGYTISHKAGVVTENTVKGSVNTVEGVDYSFNVPTIKVDKYGHVIDLSDKLVSITLPASIVSAVQTVTADETEVLSNTKFVAVKADRTDNDVVLTTEYRTQAVGTAAEGQDGLATALDVQTYVNNQIANIDQDHSETTLAAVENGGIKVNGGLVDGSENDYAYTVELVKVNDRTDENGNVVIAETNANDSFADNATNTIRVMSGVTVDAYGRVSGIQYKTIEENWDCGTYGETNN